MNRPSRDLSEVSPELLAGLMDLRLEEARVWRPDELGAILRHQMSTAVAFDLAALSPALAPKLRELTVAQGLVLNSFGDLFRHPRPPLELLHMVKDFAKAHRHHPRSALPPEVATVLYYTAIAAALVLDDVRITRLADDSLREGFAWVSTQAWVDPVSADLCGRSLQELKSHESNGTGPSPSAAVTPRKT